MDEDDKVEKLAKKDNLSSSDLRHLKYNKREEVAELRMMNVENLPTAKKDEIAEDADEIDAELRSEAEAKAKFEEEERWDNQRERQIKELEDEGSDPNNESE